MNRLGNVGVLAADDARAGLDHGHAGAEAPVDLRELQADVAAADDDQVGRHMVQMHDALVVERGHALNARQVGPAGAAAGVDENAWRLQHPAADIHLVRRAEGRMPLDHADVWRAVEPCAHTAARLFDDRILARLDALHVDAHWRIEHHTVVGGPARHVRHTRAGNQGLGRHAAVVDAGAAEALAFDDRGFQAFLAAAHSQCRPGLAGADDDGVEAFDHGDFRVKRD